jgi:hypothetical protein
MPLAPALPTASRSGVQRSPTLSSRCRIIRRQLEYRKFWRAEILPGTESAVARGRNRPGSSDGSPARRKIASRRVRRDAERSGRDGRAPQFTTQKPRAFIFFNRKGRGERKTEGFQFSAFLSANECISNETRRLTGCYAFTAR